jgi:transcription elongation factor GreA
MTTAPDLLRNAGLLADGPVRWGQRVASSKPGVFLVELPTPVATPPIDASISGKWIETVPTLLLDGERPTGPQLVRRLASFWLPSETIVYLGSTERSLGGRVGALYATPLGERRPHPGGHWLKTIRGIEQLRIWWAETAAPSEAELELAVAFAEQAIRDEVAALPDPSVVVPFANLEDPLGSRKRHGLSGYLLPAEASPERPTTVRTIPQEEEPAPSSQGRARGASKAGAGGPAAAAKAGTRPAAARPGARPAAKGTARPAGAGSAIEAPSRRRNQGGRLRQSVPPPPPASATVHVTTAGMERIQGELAELLGRRPAVIDRIRSARELGDLRENSEYQEARREQSFLEGRIQALEATLRAAVVVEDGAVPDADDEGRARLGSTVVLESLDGTATYMLVGPREADARAGRISTAAPIGQALLGRRSGDEVAVATPAGERLYRIIDITNE